MNKIERTNEVLRFETQNNSDFLDYLVKEELPDTAEINTPPAAYCPVCKCGSLYIETIAEDEAGRGLFRYKCLDCGAVFYLFEDEILSCKRGIENAKKEIINANNKIEYYQKILAK